MNIDINTVKSVYSGKDGKCCCGCAGTHWKNTDDNMRNVKRIIKKIENATELDNGGWTCDYQGMFDDVTGERIQIANVVEATV